MRHALDLDVVVLMVANVPWQKEGSRPITPAARPPGDGRGGGRRRRRAWRPGRLEIDLGGPSFTADTLAALAEREPGAELFTIVGDDAAAGLTTWERYEEVVARSTMVVVDRPGEPVELPTDVAWIHVEVPRLEVSSTDLRARFTDGRPLDYLVTDPVLDVIERSAACTRMTGVTASPVAGGASPPRRASIAAIVGRGRRRSCSAASAR